MLLGEAGRRLWYTTSSASGAVARTTDRIAFTVGRVAGGMVFTWSAAVIASLFRTALTLRSGQSPVQGPQLTTIQGIGGSGNNRTLRPARMSASAIPSSRPSWVAK